MQYSLQTTLAYCNAIYLSKKIDFYIRPGMQYLFSIWVIPCQLTHFSPRPSPILMKFGRPVDPPERVTHAKFRLIIIIIDEATALQRFLKFINIFDFGTQNIL